MVKFGKYLASHLVPEWRPAFCDYRNLKKELKRMKARRTVECRVFEGAFVAMSGKPSLRNIQARPPAEVIRVSKRLSSCKGSRLDLVETEFLANSAQAEEERPFFGSLDAELNKVIQFYKTKEKEFLEHADILDKQMQALLELKLVVDNRTAYAATPKRSRSTGDEEDLATPLRNKNNFNDNSVDIIDSVVLLHNEMLFQTILNENYTIARSGIPNKDQLASIKEQLGDIGGMGASEVMHPVQGHPRKRKDSKEGAQPSSCMNSESAALAQSLADDLSHRSLRIPEELKSSSSSSSPRECRAFKTKVQHSEKMLCEAFVEFYRGLGLLKTYSSLNMLAFTKILKKYEKVTERSASSTYMRTVDNSYFHTSDKVVRLIAWVEAMFTDCFANGDRREARRALKLAHAKSSPQVTFFLGLLTGCSSMLAIAFAAVVHVLFASMTESERNDRTVAYMTSVFPIFSMMVLLLLHMYMYGCNLYLWQRTRINYAFIFEFAPGTELSYQEVLLVCTGLTVLLGGGMLGHLASQYNESSVLPDLIPLGVVLTLFGLLFCPFNICYRSSRRFFLSCMFRIICAPFYAVILADFFLGDQLCSQVPLLRNLEYVICYYAGVHFKTHDGEACLSNKLFLSVSYMISVLPYWWRLMQCLRRYRDEKVKSHLANGGKYLSALIVLFIRIQYMNTDSTKWMVFYIVSSTFATLYQIYWDVVCDWGLLQRKAANPWLRDKLILEEHRYIYFLSMGLNVMFRFPWLLSITHFQFGGLDSHIADSLLAALEVVRRGHWNFYRLENEHLNNVGKYRAIKIVPLPFVH